MRFKLMILEQITMFISSREKCQKELSEEELKELDEIRKIQEMLLPDCK